MRPTAMLCRPARAYTLTELLGAVVIVGVVGAIALTRATAGGASSKSAACQAYRGDIEVQAELWRHNTGSWPAANLSNIGGDVSYFPAGIPLCPVDGSPYTIDGSGRVTGHNH